MAVAPVLAPLDEQSLVERARTDRDAVAELYRCYVGRIYAFAHRRCGSAATAEDVTAATFEQALLHLGDFEAKAGGFGPWLFRIAANQLVDHYRADERARGRRNPRAVRAAMLLAADAPVDPAADDGPDLDALRRGLGGLNPRYQQAVSLRYLAGLSPEEAAEAMGVSKATMAVILHRAMRALRRALLSAESTTTERATRRVLPAMPTLGKEGA